MGSFSPRSGPHPIHTVHRVTAGGIGGFLLLFGLIGAARSTEFVSTSGPVVMGLFTNGLLATLSLVMGMVLLGASSWSGPVASTVSVAAGSLFLVSGVVNVLVLQSPLNMLAFRMTNVVFSLLVGATLLILGSYGRFTGSLPASSPYARPATPAMDRPHGSPDAVLERAMADAERAVALHCATDEQAVRVRAASHHRRHDERLAAFAGVPVSAGNAGGTAPGAGGRVPTGAVPG